MLPAAPTHPQLGIKVAPTFLLYKRGEQVSRRGARLPRKEGGHTAACLHDALPPAHAVPACTMRCLPDSAAQGPVIDASC